MAVGGGESGAKVRCAGCLPIASASLHSTPERNRAAQTAKEGVGSLSSRSYRAIKVLQRGLLITAARRAPRRRVEEEESMGRKACNPARQRTHQYDNAYGSQRRAARGRAPSSNVDKDECARHLGSLLLLSARPRPGRPPRRRRREEVSIESRSRRPPPRYRSDHYL